jgi:hypothetical protein
LAISNFGGFNIGPFQNVPLPLRDNNYGNTLPVPGGSFTLQGTFFGPMATSTSGTFNGAFTVQSTPVSTSGTFSGKR